MASFYASIHPPSVVQFQTDDERSCDSSISSPPNSPPPPPPQQQQPPAPSLTPQRGSTTRHTNVKPLGLQKPSAADDDGFDDEFLRNRRLRSGRWEDDDDLAVPVTPSLRSPRYYGRSVSDPTALNDQDNNVSSPPPLSGGASGGRRVRHIRLPPTKWMSTMDLPDNIGSSVLDTSDDIDAVPIDEECSDNNAAALPAVDDDDDIDMPLDEMMMPPPLIKPHSAEQNLDTSVPLDESDELMKPVTTPAPKSSLPILTTPATTLLQDDDEFHSPDLPLDEPWHVTPLDEPGALVVDGPDDEVMASDSFLSPLLSRSASTKSAASSAAIAARTSIGGGGAGNHEDEDNQDEDAHDLHEVPTDEQPASQPSFGMDHEEQVVSEIDDDPTFRGPFHISEPRSSSVQSLESDLRTSSAASSRSNSTGASSSRNSSSSRSSLHHHDGDDEGTDEPDTDVDAVAGIASSPPRTDLNESEMTELISNLQRHRGTQQQQHDILVTTVTDMNMDVFSDNAHDADTSSVESYTTEDEDVMSGRCARVARDDPEPTAASPAPPVTGPNEEEASSSFHLASALDTFTNWMGNSNDTGSSPATSPPPSKSNYDVDWMTYLEDTASHISASLSSPPAANEGSPLGSNNLVSPAASIPPHKKPDPSPSRRDSPNSTNGSGGWVERALARRAQARAAGEAMSVAEQIAAARRRRQGTPDHDDRLEKELPTPPPPMMNTPAMLSVGCNGEAQFSPSLDATEQARSDRAGNNASSSLPPFTPRQRLDPDAVEPSRMCKFPTGIIFARKTAENEAADLPSLSIPTLQGQRDAGFGILPQPSMESAASMEEPPRLHTGSNSVQSFGDSVNGSASVKSSTPVRQNSRLVLPTTRLRNAISMSSPAAAQTTPLVGPPTPRSGNGRRLPSRHHRYTSMSDKSVESGCDPTESTTHYGSVDDSSCGSAKVLQIGKSDEKKSSAGEEDENESTSTSELINSLDDMVRDLKEYSSFEVEGSEVDDSHLPETPACEVNNVSSFLPYDGSSTEVRRDGLPTFVNAINNDIGIPKGDIMISLLSDTEDSSWSTRVQEAIWRARVMRQNFDTRWLQRKWDRPGAQPARRSSVPVDLDDGRVFGGASSVTATQKAALDHLKYDELDDALALFQDIAQNYYAFFDDAFRGGKPEEDAVHRYKPYIGAILHNLGIVHLLRGEHNEAFTYFERATLNRATCLGIGHPDHVVSLVRMAVCRFALEQYNEAHEALEESLALIREQAKSISDFRQLSEVLNNLGCIAYMGGQPGPATELFRESLQMQTIAYEHSMYAGSKFSCHSASLNMSITRANIGFVALLSRKLSRSISSFEAALKDQQLLLRDANATLTSTMDHLVVSNVLANNHSKALQLLKRMLNIQQDAFGAEDERCITTARKIAQLQSKEKDNAVQKLKTGLLKATHAHRKVRGGKVLNIFKPKKNSGK